MTRFLLPIIVSMSLLTLVACEGGKPNDPLARNCDVERTEVDRFSLCLPDGWEVKTQQFGDAGSLVALLLPAESDVGVMQMHIKKDPLNEPVQSAMTFSERAVQITRDTAPNYQAVSTEPVSIDGEEVLLHIFDASPSEGADPIRYYQFVAVHEAIAYGFTAIMFPDANEELKSVLVDIFTNVQFS